MWGWGACAARSRPYKFVQRTTPIHASTRAAQAPQPHIRIHSAPTGFPAKTETHYERHYTHAPVEVSQSRIVSGMCETGPCRCERCGSVCNIVAPYSFEITRRSKRTMVLRLFWVQASRLSERRKRSEANGTVICVINQNSVRRERR